MFQVSSHMRQPSERMHDVPLNIFVNVQKSDQN